MRERLGSTTEPRGRPTDAEVTASSARAGASPTNLSPSALTFVGREDALAGLEDLLERGGRLTTLTGAAGIGKTAVARRLGLELARRGVFPGGVWFCDLTPAASARDILDSVSAVLQVPVLEADDLAGAISQLGNALSARGPLLLILDNFEQLARVAPDVPGLWLEAAREARFLVTSRVRLRLSAERCIELPPLSDDEGVHLFQQRSQLARRGRPAPDTDRSTLEALVRRLDGLPLALELAASWTHLLSPAQLLERLDGRLDLLRSRLVSCSTRNATLRGTLDASWELLTPAEQAAFRQCGVFAGSFTAESAEEVLDPGARPDAPSVLDLLAALVDQSLLVEVPGDGPGSSLRLKMYESIRLYALERQRAAPDHARLLRRHADHVLRLSAGLLARLEGPEASSALQALQGLQYELAAVFDRRAMLSPDDGPRAALALAALQPSTAGRLQPLFAALPPETVEGPALRARLLLNRAWSRFEADQHALRTGELEAAYQLAVQHGVEDVASRASLALAHTCMSQGRTETALRWAEEGQRRCAQAGDRWGEATHLSAQGMIHRRNRDYERARACLTRAIARWRGGNGPAQASLLNNLALVYLDQGEPARARSLLQEALEGPGNGDAYEQAAIRANLAAVVHLEGRWDEARRTYLEAVDAFEQLGRGLAGYVSRIGLGILELQRGDLERAEHHLGAAASLCQSLLQPPDQVRVLAFTGAIQAARGELEASRASLDAARGLLAAVEPSGRPILLNLMTLLDGLLEAAGARAACDATSATRLRDAARARLPLDPAIAHRAPPPAPPPGGTSFYEQLAAQLLREALEVADQEAAGSVVALEASQAAPNASSRAAALVVDAQGRWFRRAGCEKVELTRRRSLCLLLRRLAEVHIAAPGTALPVQELFEAGWPGQHVQHQAATYRVYAALASLRRLGLEVLLVNQYGGYMLEPSALVVWAGAGG